MSYSDAVGHSNGRSTILHQFSDSDAVGDSYSQQLVPVVLRHFRELSRINPTGFICSWIESSISYFQDLDQKYLKSRHKLSLVDTVFRDESFDLITFPFYFSSQFNSNFLHGD